MNRIARAQKSAVFVRSGWVTRGEPGAGKEDPRADRDEVEDADDVVGRRVVRSLLVAVVEAVELGGDDPAGQADDEEDEELGDIGVDAVDDARRAAISSHDEGREQPDEVRDEERPAYEPAATSATALPERLVEDVRKARDGPSAATRFTQFTIGAALTVARPASPALGEQ